MEKVSAPVLRTKERVSETQWVRKKGAPSARVWDYSAYTKEPWLA
jgi:hypothetical protein